MYRFTLALLFAACSPGPVEATLELDADGTSTTVKAKDDTFHLNGFFSVEDDDLGSKIQGEFLQLQPGTYQTSLDVNLGGGPTLYGSVVLDVDVSWNGSGRFPFTHELRFTDGTLSGGGTSYTIVGGSLRIDNQGCRSAEGLGSALECGGSWGDSWGSEQRFTLYGPSSDERLALPLCPDDLVQQWLTEAEVRMTPSGVDLGGAKLSCKQTQNNSYTCGDSAKRVDADGCTDWRVTWFAMPNATQQNTHFVMAVGAGADCDGAPRACRSIWAGVPQAQ